MGLTAQFCMLDGVRDGPYWIEALGGSLRLRQTYVDGRLHGPVATWHPGGRQASVGEYYRDLPDGVWKRWNERGDSIATFEMQRGDGVWVLAWDNGALRARGPMVRGEKHGTWVHWRPNGKLRTIGGFRGSDRHGVWQFFNRSGEPNGTVVYDRGTGLELQWHDNGERRSRGWVRHGLREGQWTWWHDNGKRSLQSSYRGGDLHGVAMGWHRGGARASLQTFDDGKEDGVERRWTSAGRLLVERHWRDGQPHGKALYFDHLGTLRAATCFANGTIVTHRSDLEFATTARARRQLKRRTKVDHSTAALMLDAAQRMPCGPSKRTETAAREGERIK